MLEESKTEDWDGPIQKIRLKAPASREALRNTFYRAGRGHDNALASLAQSNRTQSTVVFIHLVENIVGHQHIMCPAPPI